MQILLTNYPKKHLSLLKELAKVLDFQISDNPSEASPVDKAIFAAMEESKKSGLLPASARLKLENALKK